MIEALGHPFFQRALLAGLLASVAAGVIGTYVVVKRIASISGGLSHAAFGGVGLAFLLGAPPLAGATLFGLLSAVGIGLAYRRLASGLDTLIAMVWAVGMALGILLIALTPGYVPELTSFLFGSLLFVTPEYLWLTAVLDGVILLAVGLGFKELQAVVFDEEFAEVVGVPVAVAFVGLLCLAAFAVVILIRVVGVILVIALLTIPPATARHWSTSLGRMMAISIGIGAACATAGLFLSYALGEAWGVPAPTGPLIVLIAALAYGVSALLRVARR